MNAIRFRLNGTERIVGDVPPSTTVLDWLRGPARLSGTKEGCAEGDCGACTIAVRREGKFRAVNSCLLLLPQLDGHDVMTVEGLSAIGAPLHPVQQALVDTDGTQCGFCTPGFAMAMFALGESGDQADDATIHEALAGNLCRCTGYRSIVDACRKIVVVVPSESDVAGNEASETFERDGQQFFAPRDLATLLTLRVKHPDAMLLAGGTDLGLRFSKDRERPPAIISLARVSELEGVRERDGALEIGAAATYTDALPLIEKHHPSFGALIRRLGSRQIRNLGTFAGNLATASPIGDTIPALIALGASVTLASAGTHSPTLPLVGEGSAPPQMRTLPVEDFIVAYRETAMRANEIIVAIQIPHTSEGQKFATYKLSKRFDQDISSVVAAFSLSRDGGSVRSFKAAFGGMGPKVLRAPHLEEMVLAQSWEKVELADIESVLAADFTPLSDHRASARYRLGAAAGLVRRFQLETSNAAVSMRLEAL